MFFQHQRKLIGFLGVAAIGVWFLSLLLPFPVDHVLTSPRELPIEPGWNASQIAQALHDAQIIRSPQLFAWIARLLGKAGSFQAGMYEFVPGEGMVSAFTKLMKGPIVKPVTLLVPEGYTLERLSWRLKALHYPYDQAFFQLAHEGKSKFITDFPFLAQHPSSSLEGYLFPDTYLFTLATPPEEIIYQMLSRFQEKVVSLWEDKTKSKIARKRGLRTMHQVITLASLIEKEVENTKERKLVSGVFYQRLALGMPLQSCASLKYVLPNPQKVISFEDLQYDSSYNTYQHRGLPPGPICNPGLAAIQAAFHPQDSAYLYFVADGKGGHHFSRTYEEHLAYQGLAR